jgi:hypothetical protein
MVQFTAQQQKDAVARLRKLRPIAKERLAKNDKISVEYTTDRGKYTANFYHKNALEGVYIYQDVRKRWQADVEFKVPEGVPNTLGSTGAEGLDNYKDAEECAITIIKLALQTEPPEVAPAPFYSFSYFGDEIEVRPDLMEQLFEATHDLERDVDHFMEKMAKFVEEHGGKDPETFTGKVKLDFTVCIIGLLCHGVVRYPNYESNLAMVN